MSVRVSSTTTKEYWTEFHPIVRRWWSYLAKGWGFFVCDFPPPPQKGSLVAPALLSLPPTKRIVNDLGLVKLNADKATHFILRILYTNTAKFEYIHEPLPLKLTQPFQQTSSRRRYFQRRATYADSAFGKFDRTQCPFWSAGFLLTENWKLGRV